MSLRRVYSPPLLCAVRSCFKSAYVRNTLLFQSHVFSLESVNVYFIHCEVFSFIRVFHKRNQISASLASCRSKLPEQCS